MNLKSLMESRSNALEYRERMAFVVGVFSAGDDGLLRADYASEFLLREANSGSYFVNHPGNVSMDTLFLNQVSEFRGIAGDTVENREGVCGLHHRALLLHIRTHSEKLGKLLHGKARLADDAPQGAFCQFPMMRDSQPPVWGVRMPENHVTAGLMVKLVANLCQYPDGILAGYRWQSRHSARD